MANYQVKPLQGDTLLDHLLFHRGIVTPEEKELFLNPNYELGVHDPFLLKDMDRAVERIVEATKKKEKIIIYGDFDADGIPASVVLHDFFKKIGYENFGNYIPHRHLEGFGLHIDALKKIKEEGADLIITVDCGIADVKSGTYAKELGVDLIITDHHLPGDTLPEAYAVVDPKRNDCSYPDEMLCGSGVAYKLVQGLIAYDRARGNTWNITEGWEKWLLDMVGIATLSDMVPLKGENRIFAYYGLKVLRKTPRLGLLKLLRSLDIKQQNIVEDDIGFLITPRINAASRMADPIDAFNMLTASNDALADVAVKHLNTINNERKGAVAAMMKEIKKKYEGRNLREQPVLVLGNPNWKPPLLGLVSTSLLREYDRPVFLWGRDESGILKGSCRSDGRVDIVELMQGVSSEVFINFGGHKMAGGFSLSDEHVHRFEEELCKSHGKINKNEVESELYVDAKLSPEDIHWDTWSTVEKMAPFGQDNPKPLFMIDGVEVTGAKKFGKTGDHFELTFNGARGKKIAAIKFFVENDEKYNTINVGDKVTLIANLEKSMFKNYPELRLRIVDIL